MSRQGWIGITIAGLVSAGVAYSINRGHPNWSVEDYTKLAGLWTALFSALTAAWISHLNAERQIKSANDLADQQRELQRELQNSTANLQKDLARLNASLALNLEEAKVQIANRYQAQVALNQVAWRPQTESTNSKEVLPASPKLKSFWIRSENHRRQCNLEGGTFDGA